MQRKLEKFPIKFPDKKRFQFFLFFVALSLLFWIITKLSNTYSSSVIFEVHWVDVPDNIIPDPQQLPELKVDLTASGFQLFVYHNLSDPIAISLKNVSLGSLKAVVNLDEQRFEIQQQLYKNSILNQISPAVLSFSYSKLKQKRVAVAPQIEIAFKPGYEQTTQWHVVPDSISIFGPSVVVDTLKAVKTVPLREQNVDNNIERKLRLMSIDQLKYETEMITVSTDVKRYTEKSLNVSIQVKNLPDTLAIKLFPQTLRVTFLVPIEKAGNIHSSDFEVSGDFLDLASGNQKTMDVSLTKNPEGLINIRLEPKTVDFLIRK